MNQKARFNIWFYSLLTIYLRSCHDSFASSRITASPENESKRVTDFYANHFSLLDGLRANNDSGERMGREELKDQLPKRNKASYKLIKDFPNDLVKHPRYLLVSDAHQYYSPHPRMENRDKNFKFGNFFLLLFIYFDFLAALIILNAQHHKATGKDSSGRANGLRKESSKKNSQEKKNYNKNWSWRENNQRKIKNSTKPKQHENGLEKRRRDDVSKIGVEFSVACKFAEYFFAFLPPRSSFPKPQKKWRKKNNAHRLHKKVFDSLNSF